MTQQQEQDAAVQAAIQEMQTITTMLTQRCASHAAQQAVAGLKIKDLTTQVEDARKEIKEKHEAAGAPPDPAAQ